MILSLTSKEYLRFYIKGMGKFSDNLSYFIFNTYKFGDYVDFIYNLLQSSTNENLKKSGEIFYKEISQESRENVTIGNALLSIYDYFAGTSSEEIYYYAINNGDIEALNILLKRNVYNSQNIIMGLVHKGQSSLLDKYLNVNKEIATQDFYKELACFAASNNDNTMLKLALDSGINSDIYCYNKPILVIAVKNNHLPNVKTLIGNDPNIPSNILEYALYDKYTTSGILPYLVSKDLDVNHQFSGDCSILMAAISGRQYITAKFLIEHDAELNFWCHGKTPLSEAINLGTNSFVIKNLIANGADVDTAVYGSKLLKDLLQAPYINNEDKIDIVPLMLCKGNYSKNEVAGYIGMTSSEDIKSALHSYVYSESMICKKDSSLKIFDNQEDFTGLVAFDDVADYIL